MEKSSRLIAFEILHKIFYSGSYSNIALDNALDNITESKSFVSALVYGVAERKITLDYYIGKYLKKPAKPKVMTVLRLGAYQILYMNRVPNSAAVNESVKLAKEIKLDYYCPLVNAVLHKIADDKEILTDNSLIYSVPENLLNMWYKQYGRETVEGFLPNINGRPPFFAIPNALKTDNENLVKLLLDEGIECENIGKAVMINSAADIGSLDSFKKGLFHIEDLSSCECASVLNAKENDVVLDICSAPGGKTFTIAEQMNNKGIIYAFDLYSQRLKLISDGAKRLGIDIIKTAVNDGSVFNDEIPKADKILCDVPCSGFGIIRRKPEIRYKELDSVKDLPKLQVEILTVSSRYLKNKGTLVYSTCTLNQKENERVVEAFINSNSEFSLINQKTTFPEKLGGDGFFRAVMMKNEN